jgi:succinate dehydrogenase / fumarate reductase flavoprotein subunit
MSESLRNDGRVWVPKTKGDQDRQMIFLRKKEIIFLKEDILHSETLYQGMLPQGRPRNVAMQVLVLGKQVLAVNLDFRDSIKKQGKEAIENKYGNLFDMYKTITGIDPYEEPMRIYPAGHYTMGGLWVDYELMTTIPGLICNRRIQLF